MLCFERNTRTMAIVITAATAYGSQRLRLRAGFAGTGRLGCCAVLGSTAATEATGSAGAGFTTGSGTGLVGTSGTATAGGAAGRGAAEAEYIGENAAGRSGSEGSAKGAGDISGAAIPPPILCATRNS